MISLKIMRRKNIFVVITFASVLLATGLVSADYSINSPDGRLIHLKEGTFQPDLSPYRSKLPEVKILDRTFKPKYQQWAANEEFEISQTGLNNMVRAALPLEHNADSTHIYILNHLVAVPSPLPVIEKIFRHTPLPIFATLRIIKSISDGSWSNKMRVTCFKL